MEKYFNIDSENISFISNNSNGYIVGIETKFLFERLLEREKESYKEFKVKCELNEQLIFNPLQKDVVKLSNKFIVIPSLICWSIEASKGNLKFNEIIKYVNIKVTALK